MLAQDVSRETNGAAMFFAPSLVENVSRETNTRESRLDEQFHGVRRLRAVNAGSGRRNHCFT